MLDLIFCLIQIAWILLTIYINNHKYKLVYPYYNLYRPVIVRFAQKSSFTITEKLIVISTFLMTMLVGLVWALMGFVGFRFSFLVIDLFESRLDTDLMFLGGVSAGILSAFNVLSIKQLATTIYKDINDSQNKKSNKDNVNL